MWPFSYERTRKSIESDLNDLMKRGDSIDLEELNEYARCHPTLQYLNRLLMSMIGGEFGQMLLCSSSPLPRVELIPGTKMPTFAKVVNRLKLMTNLYAVICRPPKEGTFEIITSGRTAVVHVRFDDNPADRSVHLWLEWLDEPPPPGSLA